MSGSVKSERDEFLEFYNKLQEDQDYWLTEKKPLRPMEEYELPENLNTVVMLKYRGGYVLASRNQQGQWIDAMFGDVIKKKPLGFNKSYRPDDPRLTLLSE